MDDPPASSANGELKKAEEKELELVGLLVGNDDETEEYVADEELSENTIGSTSSKSSSFSHAAHGRWATVFCILLVNPVAVFLQNHSVFPTAPAPPENSMEGVTVDVPGQPGTITIVVQNSGEMGNHISKIASGLALSLLLSQYNVTVDLKLRRQDNINKWRAVEPNMKHCFLSSESGCPCFSI